MRGARRLLVGCLMPWLLAAGVGAQDFEERFGLAEAKLDDGDLQGALDALLLLQEVAASDGEIEQVGLKLHEVGWPLLERGDSARALRAFEAALVLWRRLHGDRDQTEVAAGLSSVASCLESLGRADEALPQFEQALAMWKRLHPDRDDPDVAMGLNNVAMCLRSLGRAAEALPQFEAALAMWKRLHGGRDSPDVALGLDNVAGCLAELGRTTEALLQYEQALAMGERLHGDRDHPEVAQSLNNLAVCLMSLGRFGEALPYHERVLAVWMRLYEGRDHPDVAAGLNNVASSLDALARADLALPKYEQALAMRRRLYGDRDHPDVAHSHNGIASVLLDLGRSAEALPHLTASLAMLRRIYGDRGHPAVGTGLNNLGVCLISLERAGDALPLLEEALSLQERLHQGRDHAEVATCLHSVAFCLVSLGRPSEALPQMERALALWRRLYHDRDHPDVAAGLHNTAVCLRACGRVDEALPKFDQALAMWKRLYADRDHPEVALGLANVGACLDELGRAGEALPLLEKAVALIERLRETTRTSAELRQSLFEDLKRGNAFERLQAVAHALGRPTDAFAAAERSRGRDLLDTLAQAGDPDAEAERRARQRGDDAAAARLAALRAEVDAARTESDLLLHHLTRLDDLADDVVRTERRAAMLAHSNAVSATLRQLLDERSRLLGDVLPVGTVRTAMEIQAALRDGELLLEFTVTEETALLYALEPDGDVQVFALPHAHAMIQRLLPPLLLRTARVAVRGRDPDGADTAKADAPTRELFASLIPAELWPRLQKCRRVFIAAHRALHRLPFELLVTDVKDGKPVLWLDAGPPVAYMPSGTALHWLRAREPGRAATLDVLAVGDPKLGETAEPPGLEPDAARFVHDDLERIGKLPQLKGARAEAAAIAAAFREKEGKAELLLGAHATESAVFEIAARARYLHFACHGIAEEYAGQSLSMLVLTQPKALQPGDDGFLKLGDLLDAWRGRLASCRLVVLSACRTNVGPTQRDEAPQALPLGFLFAGAPAVISSLWAVDDASTRELMVDFYGRLAAGETDQLAAFTAAKKALRAKYPDPFHWAPFLYIGSPE